MMTVNEMIITLTNLANEGKGNRKIIANRGEIEIVDVWESASGDICVELSGEEN